MLVTFSFLECRDPYIWWLKREIAGESLYIVDFFIARNFL